MTQIDLQTFQSELPRCLERVARGETLVVVENDRALAEVRPVSPALKGPRPIGLAKGRFAVPASFFEELPEDLLTAFEGGER